MGLAAAGIVAGGSLLGGYLQGKAAKDAAATSAQAQLSAAQTAAEAQKFRPVGITTNFGSSNFQFDPNTGYLTGAGYKLSPELQAQQEQIMAGARTNLTDAERLSALGRSYISANPQEVAQNYLAQQNALLAPQREQQRAAIQQGLFNSGRGGLSVAQGGGLGASNPEMQAYYNAIAQQDAQNALAAQQYGQQQLQFGQGLLNSAYAPYQQALGLSSNIEDLGMNALTVGSQLGSGAAAAGARVGDTLLKGGMGAAQTMQQANSQSYLGNAISGLSQNPAIYGALNNYFNPAVSPNYGFDTTGGVNYGFGASGSGLGLKGSSGVWN